MGRATVYGIVKQHNGFIHVYSEPGQGSLFRVYLPIFNGASGGQPCQDPKLQPGANLKGTETILYAEDHDSIREMARQSLLNLGYRVLAADDGEQAVRLCAGYFGRDDARLGGRATAAKLLTRFPELPILFTSGYSEYYDSSVSQIPSSRYLQKPYSPTSLGRVIREILDH